ncbi:hypothetical protein GCM10022420_093300 [Streptomyces iranensis]|uniref:Uncharacterized protein n=1 Tax=Streptomyces iranensis TaxID=576784 RepID=A0A060ZCU4_9ACTN|nr:predicted protein [Streptomyces iranensis]
MRSISPLSSSFGWGPGRAPLVQEPEGPVDRPEFGDLPVLGEVPEVGQEDDVLLACAAEEIAEGRLHRRPVDALAVEAVLGVRHDGHGTAAHWSDGDCTVQGATPARGGPVSGGM